MEYKVVHARIPGKSRRVTALQVSDVVNGHVTVYARGRTYTIPASDVSRPRRGKGIRALKIRLEAEYRALQRMYEELAPRRRRKI